MNDKANQAPTASQTVGPFFSIGLCPQAPNNLVPTRHRAAEIVKLHGRVLDGDGQGVPDAILEIWRANENGLYPATETDRDYDARGVPGGFARIATNDQGEFAFETIKPGPIKGENGDVQAPHLVVLVFMRGLLRHLLTRIYFPQEAANETDRVLTAVPAERRSTLIAECCGESSNEFEWRVCLQGDEETVFFEA